MTAYPYWRVSNILNEDPSSFIRTCAELRFINTEGIPSDVPTQAIAAGSWSSRPASNAFDGNPLTYAQNVTQRVTSAYSYSLGYKFLEPVTVTSVGYQQKAPIVVTDGQAWQRFAVEASLDGVKWVVIGQCFPNTGHLDLTYAELPVVPMEAPTAKKHRYWRLINAVTVRSYPELDPVWAVWELYLYNKQGIPTSNPNNAYTPNWAVDGGSTRWLAKNVFDGFWATTAVSEGKVGGAKPSLNNSTNWYISYDFLYPVEVTKVKRIPTNVDGYWAEPDEVVSVEVQFSDDNISWETGGYLNFLRDRNGYYYDDSNPDVAPLLPTRNPYDTNGAPYQSRPTISLKDSRWTVPVPSRVTTVVSSNSKIHPYGELAPILTPYFDSVEGTGLFGFIAGTIYEKPQGGGAKVPVSRRVYLYHQGSGRLVASTWAGADGTYIFTGLSTESFFMIASVDHTGQWGLEGTAFKRALRSTSDGVSIQYPIN